MSITRRPFEPDRLDALLDFCAQHPTNDFTPALRRRLIDRLVSAPEGVIELVDAEGPRLVAATVDAVRSVADCAVLDVLGARGPAVDPALVLEPAERFVARGPRRGLEVAAAGAASGWGPALVARGYVEAWRSYDMETAEIEAPPPPDLPDPQWRWRPAMDARRDPELAQAWHRAIDRAMGSVPGSYLSSLAERLRALREDAPSEMLLCAGRVAGFATGSIIRPGVGSVDILGRDPAFRGFGLGPVLLARIMGRLAAIGARRFALDVTASNADALALYRRFGFEIVRETPVYRWWKSA